MNTLGKYQFWLCDDSGNRLQLMNHIAYFSYSRSTNGYGTIELALPFDDPSWLRRPYFRPDWRIDVWRRPSEDYPMRRECSFLIRKFRLYERASDGMLIIVYYGRSPIDILRRFGGWRLDITNLAGEDGNIEDYTYSWDSTGGNYPGNICEAMELIASGNFSLGFSYPGFSSSTNLVAGLSAPSLTNYYTFGRNALEMITELRDMSFTEYLLDPVNNHKIYFDVVEVDSAGTRFDYQFRTYLDLRGVDRGNSIVFSSRNGNLKDPVLSDDWLDEVNTVISFNKAAGISLAVQQAAEYQSSLQNKNYAFISTSTTTVNAARTEAKAALRRSGRVRTISATFLDSPGGQYQPRSLYGIDWDLGDKVWVFFGALALQCEVAIVYVSVDEDGKENVTGRNEIGS